MNKAEYDEHTREMYREILEQNGVEAIIDNILYWRDKCDSYLDGRQVKILLAQNALLRQKITNIRKSAKEYKRAIDFFITEKMFELKKIEIAVRLREATKKVIEKEEKDGNQITSD